MNRLSRHPLTVATLLLMVCHSTSNYKIRLPNYRLNRIEQTYNEDSNNGISQVSNEPNSLYQSLMLEHHQNHNTFSEENDEEDTSVNEIPSYPYEQIRKLVRDTKRILKSSNSAEKKRLVNFDQSYYKEYLRGQFEDVKRSRRRNIKLILRSNIDKPHCSGCQVNFTTNRPEEMKGIDGEDYYIINVRGEFVQSMTTTLCAFPGRYCGDDSTRKGKDQFVCAQSHVTIKKFVSVPVNGISMEQQDIREFVVPDCTCKEIHFDSLNN